MKTNKGWYEYVKQEALKHCEEDVVQQNELMHDLFDHMLKALVKDLERKRNEERICEKS